MKNLMMIAEIIFRDIADMLLQYAPYAFLSGMLLFAALYFIFSLYHYIISSDYKITCRNISKWICSFLLFVYLQMVVCVTLLSRLPGSRDALNFTLFGTFSGTPRGQAYVIENIMLFVPFGVLFPLTWPRMRTPVWCMGAGFCCSLLIELIQRIYRRGYFQLDDIIMNSLGSILGYIILLVGKKLIKYWRKQEFN